MKKESFHSSVSENDAHSRMDGSAEEGRYKRAVLWMPSSASAANSVSRAGKFPIMEVEK